MDRQALIERRNEILDSITQVRENPNTFALAQDLRVDNALFEEQARLQGELKVLLVQLASVNKDLGLAEDSREEISD